jgi:hypothetical protein
MKSMMKMNQIGRRKKKKKSKNKINDENEIDGTRKRR